MESTCDDRREIPGGSGSCRPAAVAGRFYPDNAQVLRRSIEEYLGNAAPCAQRVRMLMCPHAGYLFSGAVAGAGYGAVDARDIATVIVLGPSHHVRFKGIAVDAGRGYETPLGCIDLNVVKADQLRRSVPPPRGAVHAHSLEHAIEVQVPFIQVAFPGATIVPVLVGEGKPDRSAELLEPLLDDATLLIASSDLSHYHPHNEARARDARSLATVVEGNVDGFFDGCGVEAVRVLVALAARKGWRARVLDARTSFDTAPGSCSSRQVVGYAAVAWVEEGSGNPTPVHREYLLGVARDAMRHAVCNETCMVDLGEAPAVLREHRGCFVTLTKDGSLRGCIGSLEGRLPLVEGVREAAVGAATRDPRFPPLAPDELASVCIEISVLGSLQPLPAASPGELLACLEPGRDGVVLSCGAHRATFLPQVWEQIPDKVTFLEQLARKAGLGAGEWKGARYERYRVCAFGEQNAKRVRSAPGDQPRPAKD